jgi:hypothetical protein
MKTLLFTLLLGLDLSQATQAATARQYATLASYPDFTGFWLEGMPEPPAQGMGGDAGMGAAGGPPAGMGAGRGSDAPLKPEIAARMTKLGAEADPGDRMRYCMPFGFVGNNASFTGFDIVYSPGRITLLNEEGLIRRIYLDRKMPTDAVDSLGGTSVGHWEGSTLVVETAFIDPQSKYPVSTIAGASSIGKNAHTIERFKRVGDKLQVDLEMTAPDLFTTTYKVSRTYKRDDAHWPIQRTACVDNDRLIDPVTGKQRFDLTPPDDLPPPPSQ